MPPSVPVRRIPHLLLDPRLDQGDQRIYTHLLHLSSFYTISKLSAITNPTYKAPGQLRLSTLGIPWGQAFDEEESETCTRHGRQYEPTFHAFE